MPPNAEKLRQRVGAPKVRSTTETETTVATVKRLSQLTDTEFCIDGVVYDITDFAAVHPGGRTFLAFAGNDVTVQYKMIHPYHTEKHLLKMKRVGKVIDYTSEYVSDFHG
jgi:acyl-lipid (7-3)-desaturase (Delta-4 desaturase)